MARSWTILALALLLASAFAGCTNGDADPDAGTPPGPGGGGPGGGSGGGGNGSAPDDFVLEDSGPIQGPFTRTWDIEVANVAYRTASVHFELAGLQAGAPPTARINLQLADPEGNVVKSATLGVGGSNAAQWDLTPAETPMSGTYTLRAVSASEAPVPSAGFASYTLHAEVLY